MKDDLATVSTRPTPSGEPRRRATLKDVARLAGVHVSTVSRALDPEASHLITQEVKERIRQICVDLKYIPNNMAYALRKSRTSTIGVVIPDITNALFPPIVRGIEDRLSAAGFAAIMVNTDADPDREASLAETLISRGVDGLIIASVQREDETVLDLVHRGIGIVTVNRRLDDPSVSSVTSDDVGGVRRLVAHLAELGHRDIAHIAGPLSFSTGRVRLDTFLAAHAELPGAPGEAPVAVAASYNEAEGERCAEELMAAGARFTAVLCANDRLALGAMAALARAGRSCPADVSVTGFNDMPFMDRIDPPLTTIRLQHYEIGHRAAELMLQRIKKPDLPTVHEVLPVELMVRGSSRAVSTPAA